MFEVIQGQTAKSLAANLNRARQDGLGFDVVGVLGTGGLFVALIDTHETDSPMPESMASAFSEEAQTEETGGEPAQTPPPLLVAGASSGAPFNPTAAPIRRGGGGGSRAKQS